MNDKQSTIKGLILRVLFIIAIVIIIIILAFAIIRFLPMAFSGFASVGNLISSPFKNKNIEVNVNNANLITGDEFIVTWKHESQNPGEYKLTYSCIEGLKLSEITATDKKTILCNTRYPLNADLKEIKILAEYSKKESFTDFPIEILYVNNADNTIAADGEKIITIQNSTNPTPIGSNAGATLETGSVSNNTSATSPSSNNNTNNTGSSSTTNTSTQTNTSSNNSNQTPTTGGPLLVSPLPDLAISNAISIDSYTVQFKISNIGGQNTGTWFLSYTVPGEGTTVSPAQPSLAPGQAILYTLRFDLDTPRGSSVVTADSTNSVLEASESNNSAIFNVGNGTNTNNNSNGNVSFSGDKPDLEIGELEVGYMRGSRFVSSRTIDEGDDAAIRFTVSNRGGRSTGTWRFDIENPPVGRDDYRSDRQASLAPGQTVEIIVEFENVKEGEYYIAIELDPTDSIDELRTGNNRKNIRLRVRE